MAKSRLLPLFVFLLFLPGLAGAQAPAPPIPPPLPLARLSSPITVDGDLTDPAWGEASVIDTFFELVFGDNRPPLVRTVARVAYDDRYFYLSVECDDPEPEKIRAPYVDRDDIVGTDDNVAVFLDTRNDRRSAQEFRVNPRGIQADAMFNDANGNEDFSPDFFYDTAARITATGWQAEMRIPLTSLRYPKTEPQSWGIIVWRNYPRDRRYAIYSSSQPRDSNCAICRARELTGIVGLPASKHLVVAPYAAAQDVAEAVSPGEPLDDQPTDSRFGLDVKWSPSAGTTLDATVNPDYSQIEADTAQIAVNNRFALFYPEKRPFFLEGVDLFDTPIQALYTRTITSPRWGGRATGKLGGSSYTVLAAEDRGGGSVILPGPYASGLAPQDFSSLVGVARVRHDFGSSFLGALYAGREIEDGGYNRVFGPDFQWRPSQGDAITGQLLLSQTETPDRPDLAEEWTGQHLDGHALSLEWRHAGQSLDWRTRYWDVGDEFRADLGFVPQVGYRKGQNQIVNRFYSKGFFSQVMPGLLADYQTDREGSLIEQRIIPGIWVQGRRNLTAELDLMFEQVRAGSEVLPRSRVYLLAQIDPSRRFPRIGIEAIGGRDVDFVNVRTGQGAEISVWATLRPTTHLSLEARSALSWLDLTDDRGPTGRLFTATVQRLKATYTFSARAFVRLIGQWTAVEREPDRYSMPVPERSGDFSGSVLVSYKLNWQTAFYLGYGDERALDLQQDLARTSRQLFVKLSYAFQR